MEGQAINTISVVFKRSKIISFIAILDIVIYVLSFLLLGTMSSRIWSLILGLIAFLSSIGALLLKNKIVYKICSVLVVISFVLYLVPIFAVLLYRVHI